MPPNPSLLFLDITSASSHHLCDSVSFRKSKLHIPGFHHCTSVHFPSQQQLASMETLHILKLPLLLSCFLLAVVLNFSNFHVQALNIGVQAVDSSVTLSKDCSRKCESEFCSVPPFLRYGKYCGLLYSGCPGERPCDGLDACCMKHDACVQSSSSGYLSQECSQKLITCMNYFKSTGERTFKGNKCDPDEVIDVISVVMEAALLAGRVLHRP